MADRTTQSQPITKPILTFDQKKKSMFKSGILDMIQEKKRFLGYRPFKEINFKRAVVLLACTNYVLLAVNLVRVQ